jgi:hypothetical protein
LDAILEVWKEEGYDTDIQPQPFEYDGGLVFTKDGELNKKQTTNKNPIFEFVVPLDEEAIHSLYDRINRKHVGISFMVNEHFTQYRCIICHKEILDAEQAYACLQQWLHTHKQKSRDHRSRDFCGCNSV